MCLRDLKAIVQEVLLQSGYRKLRREKSDGYKSQGSNLKNQKFLTTLENMQWGQIHREEKMGKGDELSYERANIEALAKNIQVDMSRGI